MGMMRMAKMTFKRVPEIAPKEGVARTARLHAEDQGKVAAFKIRCAEHNEHTRWIAGHVYDGGWGECHELSRAMASG